MKKTSSTNATSKRFAETPGQGAAARLAGRAPGEMRQGHWPAAASTRSTRPASRARCRTFFRACVWINS
eukprot:2442842-Pyramimonas_sp.AAC.1